MCDKNFDNYIGKNEVNSLASTTRVGRKLDIYDIGTLFYDAFK
jgi:hypothetical protein